LALALLIAGCASGPPSTSGPRGPAGDRDGPGLNPPPDLARLPDAQPVVEPIRHGGPNKPYEVMGKSYVPITTDRSYSERGIASWYGRKFHGRRTASGEVYNMYAMTAAHPTLPIPSYARVRNPANGREVLVRVNDRGPFHRGRIVDLSYTAALKLDLHGGVGTVELERITFEDIRTGAWQRRDLPPAVPEMAPAATAMAEAPAPADPALADAGPVPVLVPVPVPWAVPTPAVAEAPASLPVADAPVARAYTAPARGFWVQLGAFKQRAGAEGFHQRISAEADWLTPLLAVFADAPVYRLQAGPYPSRDEARGVAERVREALKLVPVIVERR